MIAGTPMPADDLAPLLATGDTALARALAECGRCLGAYLLAVETRRATTCPECHAVWRADAPRELIVDVPADLEAVARWLPTIAGRAWAPSEEGGRGAPRHGERSDHVDEHHRDARGGMRRALEALAVLEAMERAGERRHVRVLWFAYVLTGPEHAKANARFGGLDGLVGEQFAPQEQIAAWSAHKSRRAAHHQLAALGGRYLRGARDAYAGTALRRRDGAPALAPPEGRDLSRDLSALLTRTLARWTKGETNCPQPGNELP